MTNGEKLQSIFPNISSRLDAETGIIVTNWADNTTKCFRASWWNAEYKEPTKNDLGVDKSDEFEEWKLNEDKDCYLRIGDIVDRFKEIDEHYNHSPWNLTQIFSNLNVLQRVECKMESPTTKNDLGVDCISRKRVLEWLENATDDSIEHALDSDLEFISSVTPQEPRWIPVSEKLPEPFTFVNATCRSLVDDREDWVIETVYLPIPKEANKHGYSDWGNIPMLNWGEAEVIAWVERIIPQPYREAEE